MDNSVIIIIISATVFLIASVINGLWMRKKRDIITYYATPNMFSFIPLVISMIGTIVGGGIVIGMTEMGAKGGIVGVVLGLGYAIAFIILSRLVPRIRNLTNENSVYSLIDLINISYKRPYKVFSFNIQISALTSLIYFTSYFFILAAQIIAIVSFLNILAPQGGSENLILLVIGILCTINIIFYSAFGGLEKDIRTDLFQVGLIFIATLVLVSLPFIYSANPFASISSLPKNYFNGTGYGIAFMIVVLLAPLPSFIVRYDIWQRIIAARTTETAKRVFIILAACVLVFFSAFSFLGMYVQSQYNLSQSEMPNAIFRLIDSGGAYVSMVILISILTAVLSSADTFLNVASISFSKLVFRKQWQELSTMEEAKKPDEEKRLKRKIIFSTIIIGLISIVIGYKFDSIVSLLIGAVSALTVLFPVVFHILIKKKSSPIAAFWSITLGYLVFILFSFGLNMPDESFIPAFIVSCIGFYTINYLSIRSRVAPES